MEERRESCRDERRTGPPVNGREAICGREERVMAGWVGPAAIIAPPPIPEGALRDVSALSYLGSGQGVVMGEREHEGNGLCSDTAR